MLVEVFAVPVLIKAVDFLFDEAKNILAERRAARQEAKVPGPPLPEIPLLDKPKAEVVSARVSDELVKRQEQAIEALLEEIDIYQRNYDRLQKRVALEGGIDFAPLAVVNQLKLQEDAILDRSQRLAAIVSDLTS